MARKKVRQKRPKKARQYKKKGETKKGRDKCCSNCPGAKTNINSFSGRGKTTGAKLSERLAFLSPNQVCQIEDIP